jgi:hypothetical protein
MALTQVTGPYPIFTDLDGTPLDDGYLYIGAINDDPETNPIQVFWDSALTIPATQPIRTSNGYAYRNGTPALIYTAGAFSITIRNKRNEFVLYSPVGYGFDPAAVSASVVKNDFIGDGVTVAFVLSASPSTILATNIFINGVYQEKDSYTLSGNTITFTVAPPLSSSIEILTNETGVINGGNANDISYTLTAAGATLQSVQTKLEQYVSVKDFGAVGDNVTDDTAAIQAALDTGLNVDLVGGQYKAANLTMITDVQSLFSSQGFARITKNANGPILTISADDALIENVGFRGEASSPIFTGDNVVVTGDAVTFNNCGSRWAYARALKISGDAPSIIGSGDIWQTADATASGYDIEIANASTTIAYPQLISIVSSQSTGGILLTNTGSHVLSAGQIGKLTINTAGGPPAGINGGMTTNMRILGDVTVAQSSGRFVGNQFGAVVVTLSAGTSGISIDQSNSFQTGSTAVNSGNSNNVIVRQTSGGSFNTFKFGPDASNATMDVYSANGDTGQFGFHNGVWVNNNKTFGAKDSGGTIQNLAYISTGNSNFFGNSNGDTVLTGNTLLVLAAAGNGRWGVEANYLYPRADNAYSLGLASFRPTVLYAVSGTINTSDGREKQQIRDLDATEKLVALRCKQIIKTYKWNEAVAKKGDDARIHIGVVAQEVQQAFAEEGLDADKYGLFCYDEWEAKEEQIDEESGFVIQPALKAGNRYGVRLDQLLAFIIGAL